MQSNYTSKMSYLLCNQYRDLWRSIPYTYEILHVPEADVLHAGSKVERLSEKCEGSSVIMANIMLNEACNLRCPYCFANEFVNNVGEHSEKKELLNITMADFKRAVDFIMTKPNERIGIIGGEPTIHPQFCEFIEYLIWNKKVTNVMLFTNGIYPEDFNELLNNPKIRILVNCNSPEFLTEKQYSTMTRNIDLMINRYQMKDRVTLGINMFRVDFYYNYIIDLLEKFDYEYVRTSITIPNTTDKRNIDMVEYFRTMKPSVFRFFRELFMKDIIPNYDCNIMPLCVMDQQEIIWLKDNQERIMSKRGHNIRANLMDSSNCRPVIDILPDLHAVRCFGLSCEKKMHINNFQTLRELENYFYNHFDTFAWNVFSSESCKSCSMRERMYCTGGCLAFKVSKIEQARGYCYSL